MFSFERLTLRDALTAIGVERTGDTITFDGTRYDTTDPTVIVSVQVNGADVDRDAHIIGDGDRITVAITTGS